MSNEEFEQFRKEYEERQRRIDNKMEFIVEQQAANDEFQARTAKEIQALTQNINTLTQDVNILSQTIAASALQAEADRQIMRNMLARMSVHDGMLKELQEISKNHEKRINQLEN